MSIKPAQRKRSVPVERKSRFSTAVDGEAMEFIKSIEDYKTKKGRSFPSWTEVLLIIKSMGYRKVADPEPLADIPIAPDPD